MKDMRKLIAVLLLIFGILMLFSVPRASADSYDVSATVPFPAPTSPAVIDPSFAGSQQTAETVELFGTCQNVYPSSIVSIWRGGQLLGSTNCQANNTFRVNISLALGLNTLVARTSSISLAYGPDSQPLSLTFTPPPPSASTPDGISPATASENAASDLVITSEQPVAIMNDTNTVTIEIKVDGGTSPYTIVINWGDGSTETQKVAGPGVYQFTHTYASPNIYRVLASVTDVLGVTKVFQFIVTSTAPQAATAEKPTSETPAKATDSKGRNYFLLLGAFIGLFVLLIIFLSSFWLGRRYEHKHVASTRRKRAKR